MVVPIPGVWKYVKEGAHWAGEFFSNPGKAAAEYFDPSAIKERTIEQTEELFKGGTPSPVTPKPAELPDYVPPDVIPDFVKDPFAKLGKYAKYAAIGGAALIGLALLRRR